MNNPPDLINVALETLVSQSLELPGFTTLDEIAAAIRAEVKRAIVFGINDRITAMERAALLATLHVWELDNESMFTRMKKPAKRPTWSRFKDPSQYLKEIDALGETGKWVEGVAESKIADFAAEAAAQDAGTLRDYDPVKQVALVACLVHTARARARDDLADMLCKRVSVIVKKAKAELDDIRTRQRTVTEKLIAGYKSVLEEEPMRRLCETAGLGLVRHTSSVIAATSGAVAIGDLSVAAGVSSTHLAQRFKELIGVTPKRLARTYRFAATVFAINPAGPIDWGDLAGGAGYFDQAHFGHEFRAFTGLTPTRYVEVRRRFLREHPGHPLGGWPLPAD